ncbi:Uncharacterized protein TCM_003386 [Theobroma cacao]|uniref:Uncharacterized protein n=1 Tax=Theobroma cacao TaxID=3641 RepID=A0A061DN74_THECC|nr:Uncharacterized protein TCM_003386 [Theobroma cacao]
MLSKFYCMVGIACCSGLGCEHSGKSKEIVLEDQESEYLEFDSRNMGRFSVDQPIRGAQNPVIFYLGWRGE